MKERILQHYISTFLGLAMVIFAGVLLFKPTHVEVGTWGIAAIGAAGILLIFAKDTLIDIIKSKFTK